MCFSFNCSGYQIGRGGHCRRRMLVRISVFLALTDVSCCHIFTINLLANIDVDFGLHQLLQGLSMFLSFKVPCVVSSTAPTHS
jgi:hypothetical protein